MNPALDDAPGDRAFPAIERLDAVIDALAKRGWCVLEHLLDDRLLDCLAAEAESALAAGRFHPAAIGRQGLQQVDPSNRRDQILWLDPQRPSVAQKDYWEFIEALRTRLNRDLYLGIERFEAQFSAYPPGAFYARHIDQFRGDDCRAVTCIVYLNRDWAPAAGGQLRLYLDEQTTCDIQPEFGTLVVFLSGRFFHEVLPAGRLRFALSGWFRRRETLC